jgi:uncharacterized pyridoxal phosphate-containing UPF0001 family protein
MKLLRTIDKEALKNNRVIPVLLQVCIADEATKFGLSEVELNNLIAHDETVSMNNIRIDGLMGMATFTTDMDQVRDEFKYLREVFQRVKNAYFKTSDNFRHVSMGMSSDYGIAIEEGCTMIRVGTIIFGARSY